MNILYTKMLEQADPTQVSGLARFFKTGPGQYGEGDKFLGIKVPVTRDVVKGCWKEVSWADLEECISSEYHEVRLAALLTLVEIYKHAGRRCPIKPGMTSEDSVIFNRRCPIKPGMTSEDSVIFNMRCPVKPGMTSEDQLKTSVIAGLTGNLRQDCIDFYLAHTTYINNWDLVDLSCYPLLGEWLLDKDRTLLYELARNGKTIWEQRIGMVSTMTFIRHGELQDTFNIADILLHHPHDLIHKAVGWLLREAGKRDKNALEEYLQPRYKTMPRTMLRYAIEKFPEEERQQYLAK